MEKRKRFFSIALDATLHPAEFFGKDGFEAAHEGIGKALIFQLKGWALLGAAFIVSVLFGGTFPGIDSDVQKQWGLAWLAGMILLLVAFIIGNLFVVSGISHLILRPGKAKGRFSTTFSVMSYSMSPALAFVGPAYVILGSVLDKFSSQMWASFLIALLSIAFTMTLSWLMVIAFVGLSERCGVSLFRAFISVFIGILVVNVFWTAAANVLTYYLVTLPAMDLTGALNGTLTG